MYLILGHSHNTADWVIAWCRNAMKGKNFYFPMAIVEAVNEVKGVNVSFIDHRDVWCLCYVSWGPILKKNFKLLLVRYMFNYFFEFDEGHVSMRSLCSTPDNEVDNVPLVNATKLAWSINHFYSICSTSSLSQSNRQRSCPSICRLHPCYHSLRRSWSPWARSPSRFPSSTYRTTLRFLVLSMRRSMISKSRSPQWCVRRSNNLQWLMRWWS